MAKQVKRFHCNEKLEGRADKKFCTPYCKSSYYYQKNKEKENNLFQKIDKQLKTNRKLLKAYNKSGLSTVHIETLEEEGFNLNYFTHYWKNEKGDVYLFCYEYGFRKITDRNKKNICLYNGSNIWKVKKCL